MCRSPAWLLIHSILWQIWKQHRPFYYNHLKTFSVITFHVTKLHEIVLSFQPFSSRTSSMSCDYFVILSIFVLNKFKTRRFYYLSINQSSKTTPNPSIFFCSTYVVGSQKQHVQEGTQDIPLRNNRVSQGTVGWVVTKKNLKREASWASKWDTWTTSTFYMEEQRL